MPQVSFPWVNGGEPFDLPQIPIAGRREMVEKEKEQAEILAEWSLANFHQRCIYILAVKKVLDKRGVTEAKTLWDNEVRHIFTQEAAEQLVWEEGEFEECFGAWYEKEVLQRLGAKTFDEALKQAEEGMKNAKWDKISTIITQHRMDSFVIGMEWRLRRMFDTIDVPGEGKLPLNRENLAKVLVWPEDEVQVREAERPKKKDVDWEDEMGHKTAEVIQKN